MTFVTLKLWYYNNVTQRIEAAPRDIQNILIYWLGIWRLNLLEPSGPVQTCIGTDVPFIYIYTGCPRRNVPDFGRVFLMLNYTDITQNT